MLVPEDIDILLATKAYNDGERDPKLLAVIGLYKCDLGDYAAARGFLESAAEGRVLHPQVYYELARLLLDEALPPPPTVQTKLDADRANKIMNLLKRARAHSPPLVGTYILLCRLLANREGMLKEEEIQFLDEGLDLFPDNADLFYVAAAVEGQKARLPEASATINRALAGNVSNAARERFEQLRTTLHLDR
jgi:hypothetical protein